MNKKLYLPIVFAVLTSIVLVACRTGAAATPTVPTATRAPQLDEVTRPTLDPSLFEALPSCRIFNEGAVYANWDTVDGTTQVVVKKVGRVDPTEDPSLMYSIILGFPGFRLALYHDRVEVSCVNPDGSLSHTAGISATIGDLVEVRYLNDTRKETIRLRMVERGRWQVYYYPSGPQA